MSVTLATMATDLREHLGDIAQASGIAWTDAQIKNAIKRVMRETWPHFYEEVQDVTTYASTNAPAVTTIELAVPSAFLASGTRAAGEIHYIKIREYTTASPNYQKPFVLRDGIYIDPLTYTTPYIHLVDPLFQTQYEWFIYGARPLAIPSGDSDVITNSDNAYGLVQYILWRSEEYLRASRQKSSAYDRKSHSQRRLIAQQRADEIMKDYRMRPALQVDYSRYAG